MWELHPCSASQRLSSVISPTRPRLLRESRLPRYCGWPLLITLPDLGYVMVWLMSFGLKH